MDANSNIQKFVEKPTFSILANTGIYVFEPKIFQYIPPNHVVSIERETFPTLLNNGEKLNGYYEEAYWADVGTITDFERPNNDHTHTLKSLHTSGICIPEYTPSIPISLVVDIYLLTPKIMRKKGNN